MKLLGIEVQVLVNGVAVVGVNGVSGLSAGSIVIIVSVGSSDTIDGTSYGLI